MINPFRRRTIKDAAKELSDWKCLNDRERVKARARLMRQEMGLPPSPVLEPRCDWKRLPSGE